MTCADPFEVQQWKRSLYAGEMVGIVPSPDSLTIPKLCNFHPSPTTKISQPTISFIQLKSLHALIHTFDPHFESHIKVKEIKKMITSLRSS